VGRAQIPHNGAESICGLLSKKTKRTSSRCNHIFNGFSSCKAPSSDRDTQCPVGVTVAQTHISGAQGDACEEASSLPVELQLEPQNVVHRGPRKKDRPTRRQVDDGGNRSQLAERIEREGGAGHVGAGRAPAFDAAAAREGSNRIQQQGGACTNAGRGAAAAVSSPCRTSAVATARLRQQRST
jgi:hypothetical protein